MGIWEEVGVPRQEEENRDETQRRTTTVTDGEDNLDLGGKARREVKTGSIRHEEENDQLLLADDGVVTTTDPQDQQHTAPRRGCVLRRFAYDAPWLC